MKSYKLKGKNKIDHKSFDYGNAERNVFLEIYDVNINPLERLVTFKRKIYVSVETIIQESFEDLENDISIPEVKIETNRVDLEVKEAGKLRYFDEKEVSDFYKSPLGTSITKSKGYWEGQDENVIAAILNDVNNDEKIINIGAGNFEII